MLYNFEVSTIAKKKNKQTKNHWHNIQTKAIYYILEPKE